MKLAILSDIHANLEALRATLDEISAHRVDRIVCLGDVVGYNANPNECVALLRQQVPLCVAGNHDRAATGQITTQGFSQTAARAIEWTRSHLDPSSTTYLASRPLTAAIEHHIVAVHGALHPDTGQDLVRLETEELLRQTFEALLYHPSRARVCAFGHTHRLGVFELRHGTMQELKGDQIPLHDDAYYLVNPGSVGQQHAADRRASFLVLDTARRLVTVHRVSYDVAAALGKTQRAGLAPPLSFLPDPVRKSLKWGVRAVGLSGVVRRIAG